MASFAGRRVVEVSAGGSFSAAVDECGGLWTWGDGSHGKLGHGDSMVRVEPTQVLALLPPMTREEVMAMSVKEIKKELARRHEPFEERSKAKLAERLLAAQPKYEMPVSAAGTSIHQDTRIRHVSAGIDHTLAVTFSGEVYGWGCDLDDQLGLGGRVDVDADRDDSQWWPQLIGAPKPYGENEDMLPVRQVSAGKHHSVILTESGEVFAMGSNEFGQLGIESSTGLPEDAIEGTPIPASVDSFNVVTEPYLQSFTVKELKAKLERRGESTVGVKAVLVARLLAAQPVHDPVVEVAAGYMHTLARTASGKIYSWGNGEQGRLGLGDEDDRVEPTLAMYVTNA
jgi:alpha-tubulin suppressor-like RCC1 family protein